MVKVTRTGLLLSFTLAAFGCSKPKDDDAKAGGEATATKEKAATGKESGESAKPAKTEAAGKEGPIAKVNGVTIPRAEFDEKYAKMTKAFTTRNKEIPEGLARRYKQSILKQLVEKQLLEQKIEKAGVKVEPAELEEELAEYKKMFRTEENFQRYLRSSSVTLDKIKDNIRHNLAVKKLLEKEGSLEVTDADVKAYYDKNKGRYEVKEQVRASHILFKVKSKADKEADAKARKQAEEVYEEAKKKDADFAALAKKHSQGPTASRGGDLSYFTRGRMVPEFEKVAFSMKPGEVSKPVRTQFGWHVIKVTDKKEGRQRPFDEVKESIQKLLRNKKTRKAKAELLKTLKADAEIETFLPETETKAKAAKKPEPKKPESEKPESEKPGASK